MPKVALDSETFGRFAESVASFMGTAQFLVSPIGYQVALWLAVAAPALWFVTAYVLTRASKSWVRIVWLIAGLVVLVP